MTSGVGDTVELSNSEFRALVTKAARGAGHPWGMAEEAGWAAEWLARRGLPAADWIAEWLSCPAGAETACPVALGLALGEAAGSDGPASLETGSVVAPMLVLPFVHRVALAWGADVELRWEAGAVTVTLDGEVRPPPAPGRVVGHLEVRCKQPAGADHAAPRGWAQRPRLSLSVLDRLEGLALRTTVPPSSRSRSDAGAGQTDND
jgi:hypothetical protein